MSKRRPMGEAARALMERTGADAMAAVTEETPAPPARKALRAVRVEPPEHERWIVTNVRLREKHWAWLRREAMERALRRPGSRNDGSEVVRELIEDRMESTRHA